MALVEKRIEARPTKGEAVGRYSRPYPIVSADCHVNMTADVFGPVVEKYPEVAFRAEEHNGRTFVLGEGLRPYPMLSQPLEHVWGDDDETYGIMTEREARRAWATTAAGRLADELRDDVEVEVLYPGPAATPFAAVDLAYQIDASRCYNDWLADWIRGQEHRMVATAMVPLYLDHLDATIDELVRARELGYRSANLPVSVPWLPYSRPEYDRLWSAFEDLDMIAAFHVFTGNAVLGSDFADALVIPQALIDEGRRRTNHWEFIETIAMTTMGVAAGMSPVAHLTGSGALDRHPKLRFVIVEAEMGWLGWVLQMMDSMAHKRKAHFGDLSLSLLPSEYFKRQGWITFTDDEFGLAQLDFVGSDRVMWSNDYHHDEGTFLESRATIERLFENIEPSVQRQLLWANAAELYGLDEQRVLADRVVDSTS